MKKDESEIKTQFAGGTLASILVTFPEDRVVLQGNVPVGLTNQAFQLSAGVVTLTLAVPGEASTQVGDDFDPKAWTGTAKAGGVTRVEFKKV